MAERTVWGDFLSTANLHLNGVEWSLNGTLSMLWRRWPVIAASTLLVAGLMFAYLIVTPPSYTAKGLLQINTRQEQVMAIDDVMSGLNANDAAIRTEVDVLKSRKVAKRVVDELKLVDNPEFSGGKGLVGMMVEAVKALVMPADTDEANVDEKTARDTKVVDAFLSRLNVTMLPRSFSIQVEFTSRDAKLSAQVVNALTNAYLTSQLEDRLDAARRATEWMGDRSKQLQLSLQTAELAVERFREANNLTTAKGVTLNEQQLSELNSQLILARAQLAEVQAKSNNSQAVGRGLDTTSEVLNSPLIQNLRMQETEVRRKMSDLAARYGARHPRMVTVRNELSDVQSKIGEESRKIRGSLVNDVAVSEARVRTFEQQLEKLQKQNNLSSDAEVQLAELERQAASERSLYESFLNRSKELAQMDFVQSDARVIYPAETPLKPSEPQKLVLMAVALLAGLGLGVGLVLALEALDSGFRTVQQVENSLKVAVLGMLGEIPGDGRSSRAHYVVEKPTGAYTEGVRAVRAALQFAKPDTKLQTIVVTSSVPQEGKSLLAASMAQVTAMAGGKTLLIDADLRRPTQARNFDLEVKVGLAEVLGGQATLKEVLKPVKGTNLTVLPAMSNAQFSQELLGSQKMKDLMAELRKTYETIIIDSPPVMAVADALTLSTNADALLFAVRWGTTPRPLALSAVKQLQNGALGVTGAVLTRVDLERQQAYGYGDYGYYYGKYKDYYND